MSSDPFRLLGLDRKSATEADVRRAYAERLKLTRPEDDRAGFMALRAAFEQARSEARWREQYGDAPDEEAWEEDAEEEVLSASYAVQENFLVEEPAPELVTAPDHVDPPEEDSEEEEDYDIAVNRAMAALVDVLTGGPFGVPVKRVMAIVEADEVSGIEDYQTLQWRVRDFLCDRTGFNLDPPELRRPDWLTLDLFDTLDGYFGWTRQPVTQVWVRKMNDWLVRVRRQIAVESLPMEERKKAELSRALEEMGQPHTETRPDKTGGGIGWLGAAGGIIGYALFQFFTRNSGGG
ncbi:hypothetical protein [Hyphomonas sp.]|uniref:hypothetical protein n=1 Tax=Hyphomonas sp. TaxID=87 RepID=UPI00391A47C7